MARVQRRNRLFKTYPYWWYATDVTFQNINRPSGVMEERNAYYSGEHKLYGYNVEVSVLPVGLAVNLLAATLVPAPILIFIKNMLIGIRWYWKREGRKLTCVMLVRAKIFILGNGVH